MRSVNYTPEFKEVIQLATEKKLFIGSGNPNSKILIIGKEAAIDIEKSADQHEREFLKNCIDWDYNHSTNKQFTDVESWFIENKYNPLYSYKGQKNKIRRVNKENKAISGDGGTSKTWYNYQRIIDKIYFNDVQNLIINFHEYSFSSELSQETGSYSRDIPKNKRAESIGLRKELFTTPFFRKFPITIVAVGHYVRDFDIDLQNLFEIKFNNEHSEKLSEGLNREYINIHYDNPEKPTRLLIHTNQLSMVSNELINRLSRICRDFESNLSLFSN
ncbi:hypothetical protein [Flavobacterium suzhouense]|uniref:Uncharacterized protein n=1 Tax=Flavobacterium suzhouense TaxID=1529638 RepID=A0ABW5NPL7_9FLAO